MNKRSTRSQAYAWKCGGALLGAWLTLFGFGVPRARANGAFPDSQGLLLPADNLNEMILATNFGVIVSQDGGQTWTWSCERMDNGSTAAFYQMSAAPRDRLFAITDIGLIYSDDAACGWGKAQGMLAGKSPLDYFPDAANQNRIWAVRPPDATGDPYTVVESLDGGNSFTTIRFTAVVGDAVTGLEISRTDPNVAYLTIRSGSGFLPKLATTKNGGATWDTRDLSGNFGNVNVRIIAVDPTNPSKLLLRVSPLAGDSMAISLDGGQTFVSPSPLTVPDGILTSFVRLPSGTLILGGVHGVRDVIFRSTNGGTSFTELDAPPVRGLGTRNGRLFIVSSNDTTVNGYAVGESTDEGTTWQPLMRYEQIQAIEACVKALCQDDCTMKADIGIWPPDMCDADPMPHTSVDGSAPVDARGGGAGASGNHPDASSDGSTVVGAKESGACGCRTGAGIDGDHDASATYPALGVGVVAALAFARRRRTRRASPRS
jgi:hypothetical protein